MSVHHLRALIIGVLFLMVMGVAACGAPAAQPAPAVAEPPAPATEPTPTPASEPAEATNEEAGEAENEEAAAPDTAQAEGTAGSEAALRTFTIAPDRSEVRFVIGEILSGSPKTVIGVNNQVEGELRVDPVNPADAQLGAITINAGGFVTDDNRRNNAIRRFVLQTDRYPFVRFTPTEINGLPASVNAGDSFDFQVTGDLAILTTTRPVVFELTAQVVSEDEIQITGSATIARADFGLSIPSVPFVASVDENLGLELDLVAVANPAN
jgi:polyisoprenoid-binding protein YceI